MSDDVLKHIPALRAYARALCKTVPDAEDLVQETLLRAIENAHRYQPGTNMRAWLFTIMRNRFFTNCHKAGQEWYMRTQEMNAVLRQMPRHYREAIILVGALGESYIEAARLLDCDIGTIKSRVNRARGMLRKALEPAL